MPLFLEEVAGFTAAASGRWLAVIPLAALVAAPLAGRLADRVGARPLTVTGLGLTAAGLWALAQLGVGFAPGPMLSGLCLVGLGLGLFSVPNASALLSLVPPEQLGLASGLQGTMRNLGLASGLAITGAIVASRYAAHGGGELHLTAVTGVVPSAFVAATRELFRTLAGCALAATLLAWRTSSGRIVPAK